MSRSTKNSRSAATSRGNVTRAARKLFESTYGSTTAKIVRLIAAGLTTASIRSITGASPTTIATYRANLTRGIYYPFVLVDNAGYYGSCNYSNI